ncbi:MAG: hypothetical protein OHK0046_13270 [Anaerolineae bacterium]
MQRLLLFFVVMLTFQTINAQDSVTVPDLTGLAVPQAAALLNENQLRLGAEIAVEITEDAAVPVNTIAQQSIAAGEAAAPGTVIDITVLRAPNALLIYDDNDVTLVNQTGGLLDLTGLAFASATANFNAIRWGGALEPGDCGQLWSVGRTSAKDVPECSNIRWLTTNNPVEHFWTNGAPEFVVSQNGVIRTSCVGSTVGTCAFFLASGATADVTEYLYLVYTPQTFMIRNPSPDKWMPLAGALAFGTGLGPAGSPLVPDVSLFDSPDFYGDLQRLAPNQCHIYTNNADGAPVLEDCTEVARASVNIATPVFWNGEFGIQGTTTGRQSTCPAAVDDRLTICIVPR